MSRSTQFMNRLGLKVPIIQAPMAGISTVKLAAETANYGALGSLPMAAIDLKDGTQAAIDQIEQFRMLTKNQRKVNVNFFHHDPQEQLPPSTQEIENWYTLFSASSDIPKNTISQTVKIFSKLNTSFAEFESTKPDELKVFIQTLGRLDVGVVSFHFGLPLKSTVDLLQKEKIIILVTVTSVQEAVAAKNIGVDGVVCQGYEAGGHRGNFLQKSLLDENLSTESLFMQVKRAFNEKNSETNSIPYIIPAGGIVDGKTAARYIKSGASAVQMGTIFVPALESNAPDFIARLVTEKRFLPTIMTGLVSGKPARMLRTPFVERLIKEQSSRMLSLPAYGYQYSGFKQFASFENTNYGCYLIGQNYRFVPTGLSTNAILRILTDNFFAEINYP